MFPKRDLTRAAILLTLLILLIMALGLVSCARMQAADAVLWGTPATPATINADGTITPAQPGTSGVAPPVIEITAAVASLLGFGGLARWISNIKKNGTTTAETLLLQQSAQLQEHTALAGKVADLDKLLTELNSKLSIIASKN